MNPAKRILGGGGLHCLWYNTRNEDSYPWQEISVKSLPTRQRTPHNWSEPMSHVLTSHWLLFEDFVAFMSAVWITLSLVRSLTASKLAGLVVFQEYVIIFITPVPIGCRSAFSGNILNCGTKVCSQGQYWLGHLSTTQGQNSVFSIIASGFLFFYRIYEV